MPFKDRMFSRVDILRHGNPKPNESIALNFLPQPKWDLASSLSPDANGNANVAHGLSVQPAVVIATLSGDVANVFVDVQVTDDTNITLRFKDGSGNDVTSGTYAVYWWAATDWVGG